MIIYLNYQIVIFKKNEFLILAKELKFRQSWYRFKEYRLNNVWYKTNDIIYDIKLNKYIWFDISIILVNNEYIKRMYKLNKLKIVRKFKNFDEFKIESIRKK